MFQQLLTHHNLPKSRLLFRVAVCLLVVAHFLWQVEQSNHYNNTETTKTIGCTCVNCDEDPLCADHLLSGMNFNSSNYQLTMAKADLSSLRVIIHNRWDDKPGGAEALLQLTLAFHSWMPNQTYAQGHTDARIIKDHWLDWYPEINRLNVVHEQNLRVGIADKKVFRRGDIYVSEFF